MPKQFITERDIEDLAGRGVSSLDLSDDVVLTDLARERALRAGIRLERKAAEAVTVQESAVRPTQAVSDRGAPSTLAPAQKIPAGMPCAQCAGRAPLNPEDLRRRIHDAAVARMGTRMEPALIDTIIERVIDNIGLK